MAKRDYVLVSSITWLGRWPKVNLVPLDPHSDTPHLTPLTPHISHTSHPHLIPHSPTTSHPHLMPHTSHTSHPVPTPHTSLTHLIPHTHTSHTSHPHLIPHSPTSYLTPTPHTSLTHLIPHTHTSYLTHTLHLTSLSPPYPPQSFPHIITLWVDSQASLSPTLLSQSTHLTPTRTPTFPVT